jgi:predicted dehydrogenase
MQCEDTRVMAIASKTRAHAAAVAKEFSVPVVCDTVGELLERDDIDIVYIGVPHTSHHDVTLEALRHGKHVLCEKPLAINRKQAAAMIAEARKRHLFLMEAMWMRFFPAIREVQAIVARGDLGRLRSISATFASDASVGPSHRLLNPALAGGALLDVGVYCLQFCDAMTGSAPTQYTGIATIDGDEHRYGVDEQDVVIARYPGNVLADLRFAVKNELGQSALLSFTGGTIWFERFWSPTSFVVTHGAESEKREFPVENKNPDFSDAGFQYEIRHVNECLRKNLVESDIMGWEKTERTLEICDRLRSQWNLVYPDD